MRLSSSAQCPMMALEIGKVGLRKLIVSRIAVIQDGARPGETFLRRINERGIYSDVPSNYHYLV
jgi:hypothetical protein